MDAFLCRPLFLALFAMSLVAVLLWFRYHVTDPLTLNF
jgi:hypothetical protein